jgi:hypothetical protein
MAHDNFWDFVSLLLDEVRAARRVPLCLPRRSGRDPPQTVLIGSLRRSRKGDWSVERRARIAAPVGHRIS